VSKRHCASLTAPRFLPGPEQKRSQAGRIDRDVCLLGGRARHPGFGSSFDCVSNWTVPSLLLAIAGATAERTGPPDQIPEGRERILRGKLPKRITVTPKEKNRLLRFALKLGGKVLRQLTTIVTPETFLKDSSREERR